MYISRLVSTKDGEVSWNFKPVIDNKTGDVMVVLEEILDVQTSRKNQLATNNKFVFTFSSADAMQFIADNTTQNVFFQCNLEGAVGRCAHAAMDRLVQLETYPIISGGSIIPLAERDAYQVAVCMMALAVFRQASSRGFYAGGDMDKPGVDLYAWLRGRPEPVIDGYVAMFKNGGDTT